MRLKVTICILIMTLSASKAIGQETVFALLKNDLRLADRYFKDKDYQNALKLYRGIEKKKPSKEIELKIARSHHFLKQYSKAVAMYDKYSATNSLSGIDLYYYAEAQTGILEYDQAIETYKKYLPVAPDDELIMKKIWRLSNLQYLFEDSSHFVVRPLRLNSEYGEMGAVPYKNGLVFISNRKAVQAIEKIDATTHSPFYRAYFSPIKIDTLTGARIPGGRLVGFDNGFNSKFHDGPLTFYDSEQKMVFTAVAAEAGENGTRTMQLYFAEYKEGKWKMTTPFPYNSGEYSMANPAITEDGRVLYFSSDMKGGFGGKDLYKSEFINEQWTKPVNLGEFINTSHDEVSPFLFGETLYFASDGHPGLGGLDIFKAEGDAEGFMEPENVGYPINTNYDDFGMVVDSTRTHGYFSSNRQSGGYDDDVYEVEMDLQAYPLQVRGVMKLKDAWTDSLEFKILANARLFLIDNNRDVAVQESSCDEAGNFLITVPYYSKFKIKVVSEDDEENIVSLDIPKYRREQSEHEIVIVRDAFKSNN